MASGIAFVTVIVLLALIQYIYFGFAVGRARSRHGVTAPATSGDETFERFYRAHQNTLEQLVVFIPAIYAAGYYMNPLIAVAIGVVFLIGRTLYFRSYIQDPQKRGPGMIATMLCNVLLIGMGLIGAVRVAMTQA
ncbi:MAG: MAPEG family protein [Pseudomonadota bacterium]